MRQHALLTLLGSLLLTPAFLSSPPTQQDDPRPSADQAASPATAEDIEVLRRLLADSVGEQSVEWAVSTEGTTVITKGGFIDVSSSKGVKHSRGFHVPGRGAFFSIDLELPVVEATQEDDPGDTVKKTEADQEWDRIRQEVRTGVKTKRRRSGTLFGVYVDSDNRAWQLDPKAIEKVEEALLTTLGLHGARVEGLGPRDVITVGVHMKGKASGFAVYADDTGEVEQNLTYGWLGGELAARQAPPQRLVIQVDLSTLEDAKGLDGRMVETLRRSASIHRY